MAIVGNINCGTNVFAKTLTLKGFGDGASGKRITWQANGDTPLLHGSWSRDNVITDSDRRLKENITPLGRELRKRQEVVQGAAGVGQESAVSWVLRELRPVSFKFKSMVDSKEIAGPSNYGFIAQEVERVAPSLVVKTQHGEQGPLSLLYQDLLAVLTLAFKEQQTQLSTQDTDVADAQREVLELLDAAEKLDMVLDHFEASGGPETDNFS